MTYFIALPLPDRLIAALEPLLGALPVGNIVPTENLHLTLAFLGEQPDWQLRAVHEELTRLKFGCFPLQLSGLGTFGEASPRAVWAGVKDDGEVRALQGKVLGALHLAGLDLARRKFRPHVTLSRLSRLAPDEEQRLAKFLGRHHSFPAPEVEIDSFALYRSHPGKGGSIYEVMADYPLL